jgi:hypothetical protein
MQGAAPERARTSPKYWQDGLEADIFKPIVKQYLEQGTLDAEGIAVMRAYLRYWINSSIWADTDELRDLRDRVARIEDAQDVQFWLRDARKLGIEPL